MFYLSKVQSPHLEGTKAYGNDFFFICHPLECFQATGESTAAHTLRHQDFSRGIHSSSHEIKSGTWALLASLKAPDLIRMWFTILSGQKQKTFTKLSSIFFHRGFSRVFFSYSSLLSLGLLSYLWSAGNLFGGRNGSKIILWFQLTVSNYSWFHVLLLVHIRHIQIIKISLMICIILNGQG